MATRLTTILVSVIVGATFVAGLIVGAQRDDASGPVDVIVVNARVYPGSGAAVQEAVAIRGNQILRVGPNREIKRLRRAQTVVLDAHGATVLPGLNDSHVQLLAGGLALDDLDLSAARTLDEVGAELLRYAEEHPLKSWLLGRRGDSALLASTDLAAWKTLDRAVQDRPVLVLSKDGSVGWANSKALELAGISRRTKDPKSGTIVKDSRSGKPTGVLREAAIDLVTRVRPEPTRAEKAAALRAAIAEAHTVGITSLQSVSATYEELELLDEIRQEGALTVRAYASIALPPNVTEPVVLELNALRQKFPDDPTLKLGGVVVACPCGGPRFDAAIAILDKHNWPVMVRTAGGADVGAAVAALTRAKAANHAPNRDARHRLDEHLLIGGQARILLGSGWPAGALDPREALEASTGSPDELRRAIDAYTDHAAFASYDEHRKGKLARGMLADLVILSNDIFDARPDALRDTAVMVTIFDGKVVYQRPTSASSND